MLGHNNPPTDVEILQGRLVEDFAELLKRTNDMMELADGVPNTCQDDSVAGAITDLIKNINCLIKDIEVARKKEKEIFLDMGRAVDTFFKRPTDSLEKAKKVINVPLSAHLQVKAEEERQRRLTKEEALRREADARLAEAAALEAEKMTIGAAIAHEEAMEIDSVANRVAASLDKPGLAKTRTLGGSTASLRTMWVGEVANIADVDLEPLRFFFSEAEICRAVKAFVAAGGRQLKGAHIFEKSIAVVR